MQYGFRNEENAEQSQDPLLALWTPYTHGLSLVIQNPIYELLAIEASAIRVCILNTSRANVYTASLRAYNHMKEFVRFIETE